jgi:hypothetical protein
MFNTAIVEVAIGLVFVFALMAMLVTQINGIVTSVLNLRAKELKKGLLALVTDDQLGAKVLGHPVINMVKVSVPAEVTITPQVAKHIIESGETRVGWIPSSTFVEAFIGILALEVEGGGLYKGLQEAINDLPISNSVDKSKLRELASSLRTEFSEETIRKIYGVIGGISDEVHQQALLGGVKYIEDTLASMSLNSNQLVPLLHSIEKIDDPKLKSALKTILSSARNMEEAQQKLESWFDDGMSKVSDAFKRRLQLFSFVTALILVMIFNVDTIALGRTLWEDPELRRSVTAAATDFDDGKKSSSSSTTSEKDLQRQTEEAQQTIQGLLELQLPVGWQYTQVTDEMIDTSLRLGLPDPRSNARNVWNYVAGDSSKMFGLWMQKIIGLLATTIAAAQGAPFWFDFLNKLTSRK